MRKNNIIKTWLPVVLMAIFTASCAKDEITYLEADIYDTDDDIANTTFDRTVYVEFSTSGDATVSGASSDDMSVTVSGNDVTIVNSGDEVVMYVLSGTTTDGFFKLYSTRKQGITLNGANITNKNGAAINVQGTTSEPNKGKRTFIVVNSDNSLADGTSYTGTPDNEDEKAALFSEGQLIFSGTGSLAVTATGKSGIVSDDYIRISSDLTLNVSSTAGHGIKTNDFIAISSGTIGIAVTADTKKGMNTDGYVSISGGDISINVTGGTAYDSEDGEYKGSAGIKADGYFKISGGNLAITNSGTGGKGISSDSTGSFTGGTITVTTTGSNYGSSGGGGNNPPTPPGMKNSDDDSSVSAKAIKFDGDLTFSGAKVTVNCTAHEGIESKSALNITAGEVYSYSAADDAINSGGDMTITGGYVCGYATSNDGLDANGDCHIKGGVVYAIGSSSPEVAIDANTEQNKQLYVEGGTIVAIGGLEQGSSLTQSCYSASSWSANTWYGLTIGSTIYAFKTPTSGGTPLVVSGSSTPTLQSDVTTSGGTEHFEGIFIENTTISGGTSVSLSSYSGGNGGGQPGGGGNQSGGGNGHGGGPF